ncbi:MAG: hypothetical protein ABH871_00115 [Pseudomonadota bacterium]
MKYAGFTKQERTFITLMRVWMVAFFGTGILFATIPNILLNYINDIGKVFVGWHSPPIASGGYFWLVLAVALLAILTYSCALAQASPLRNFGYARLIIISKFISAIGFAALLYINGKQFYYLVGAVIDGLIFIITLGVYIKASKSRG